MKIGIVLSNKPFVKCEPNSGYRKVRGIWRYNSASLHKRINRRVGLTDKVVWTYTG